jgi:DNA polymerase/3'-5' exonuclease PolX
MANKNNIIEQLNKLKISYFYEADKKWQIKSLQTAIQNIEKYNQPIISGNQLKEEIKGIGQKICKYIDEIIEYGYIFDLENKELQENSYKEFMEIIGVGQAKAKEWITKGIKNIEELKEEIKKNNISITNNIELGLKYYDDLKIRIPREEINDLKKCFSKILNEINKDILFEICGSYRRNELDSGDIDFLITHKNYNSSLKDYKKYNFLKNILDKLKENNIIVDEMTKNASKKFLGMCKIPNYNTIRRIDIMFIDYKSYYNSLLYFTGNKYFNLYLRNKCLENNYSLNEYYLTNLNNDEKIYLENEEQIFKILNINYLKPEERKFLNNKK